MILTVIMILVLITSMTMFLLIVWLRASGLVDYGPARFEHTTHTYRCWLCFHGWGSPPTTLCMNCSVDLKASKERHTCVECFHLGKEPIIYSITHHNWITEYAIVCIRELYGLLRTCCFFSIWQRSMYNLRFSLYKRIDIR